MERREAPGACEAPLRAALAIGPPRAPNRKQVCETCPGARAPHAAGLRGLPPWRCASRRSTWSGLRSRAGLAAMRIVGAPHLDPPPASLEMTAAATKTSIG